MCIYFLKGSFVSANSFQTLKAFLDITNSLVHTVCISYTNINQSFIQSLKSISVYNDNLSQFLLNATEPFIIIYKWYCRHRDTAVNTFLSWLGMCKTDSFENMFYTHGLIKLFIAAMAYYINTLNSQSSGRGRCWPNYFKVGYLFWKSQGASALRL